MSFVSLWDIISHKDTKDTKDTMYSDQSRISLYRSRIYFIATTRSLYSKFVSGFFVITDAMRFSFIKYGRLLDFIAAVLIFLFVYTASSKLFTIDQFKAVISVSPLLGDYASLLSWLIPSVELVVSLLIFLPFSRKYGLLFSSILMGIFTLYIAYMLLFSPDLPCSCGGVLKEMSWSHHLIFNIIFFFLSVLGWSICRSLNKDFIAISRQSRIPV